MQNVGVQYTLEGREEVHTEGKPGPKPEQSVQDGNWLCASGEEDVCVWQTRQ